MVDETTPPLNPVAETALSWVMRQHEWVDFDDAARAELAEWLAANPEHRKAYDKASRIWQLSGMIPPVNDLDVDDR